jgi:tetratricopeptide (TPR) repeat protein
MISPFIDSRGVFGRPEVNLESHFGGNDMKTIKTIILLSIILSATATAQQRFDMLVRDDFFAGISGDTERFERAMHKIEDARKQNPKDPEIMVWHGAGLYFQSGLAFAKNDTQNGITLRTQGIAEMNKAVKLAPDNVSVRIPRGAVLISSARYAPPQYARPLLEAGVSDYEQTLRLQSDLMDKLSTHSKGELLLGLADGYSQLGNVKKAKQYFDTMATDPILKGSKYEQKANAWLENKPEAKSPEFFQCSGCHKDPAQ